MHMALALLALPLVAADAPAGMKVMVQRVAATEIVLQRTGLDQGQLTTVIAGAVKEASGAQVVTDEVLAEPEPEEDLQRTRLPLRLLGTVASDDQVVASAAIENTQDRLHQVVRVGHTLTTFPQHFGWISPHISPQFPHKFPLNFPSISPVAIILPVDDILPFAYIVAPALPSAFT